MNLSEDRVETSLLPTFFCGGFGGLWVESTCGATKMRLSDYLRAKYGVHSPTTILFVEAKAFGIKYPLTKGWLSKHGDKEITPDVAARMRTSLESMIKRDHPRADSARLGIKILDDANIEIKSKPEARSRDFLKSKAWLRLRLQALKIHGNQCQSCGASPNTGAVLNVDHIRPRRLFPELALDIDNLQVLCSNCNSGKGNWDMTDFRTNEERE